MRKLLVVLIVMVASYGLAARKPADTLTTGKWEFVQNLGQWPSPVRFAAHIHTGALFFSDNCFTVTQLKPEDLQAFHDAKHSGKPFPSTFIDAAAYRVSFVESNPNAHIVGNQPYNYYHNYYLGNNPKKWASNVPIFARLLYQELYPGVNLLFLDAEDYMKYEFHVAPHADPTQIRMRYDGVKSIAKVGEELLLYTAVDRVLELKPYAYQIDNKGDTLLIKCAYHLQGNVLSFDLGEYDTALPLVIDPTVVFSSFTGSTADNWGYTATYDSHGNLYGGGIAFNVGYPTTLGAYQVDFCGEVDVAISKFDATGSFLHYSTYLGGSLADIPHSLYVNDNDELYIFGTTGSADFPVTDNAFDTLFHRGFNVTLSTNMHFPNGSDIFVSKLSADGTQLAASTFVGGSGNDGINTAGYLRKNYADDNRGEIIVDGNSNVYVVSSTESSDFPTTSNSYQPNSAGGQEVCLFKMSQDLSTMIWSSYFGGSRNEAGYSLFLANDKSLYFCGGTTSHNLPVTPNAIQPSHADSLTDADGFVAHFSPAGNLLLHSTYLGKSDYDQTYLIKGDDEGIPHVLGQTSATGMAWVHNASYYVPGGGQFLAKLAENLDMVICSTAFGTGNGGPDISPTALMVDFCNNVYLSGWGSAQLNGFGGTAGLPTTEDAFQSTTDGSDFYFMALAEDMSNIVYASFFGGAASQAREHVDGGTSRFDKHGRIYQAVCAGCGGQSSFPTTVGAYATTNGSSNCNLGAIKIDFNMPVVVADFLMPNVICLPDTVFFSNYSQLISDQSAIWWDFGDGTTSTEWEPHHLYAHSGDYEITLVVQDLSSCNSADTLRKRILALANTSSTLPTISICQGDYAELGIPPSVGVDYSWSPTADISNPHISNPIATPNQSTIYSLIASTEACVDTLFQQVDVHTVNVNIIYDSIICPGSTTTLSLLVNSADPYRIFWSETADFQHAFAVDVESVQVAPANSRFYYVRVETDFCTKTYPIHISINDLNVHGNEDYLICFEDYIALEVQVNGGLPPYNYSWQLGDGSGYTDEHPHVSPQQATMYTVIVTDSIGCTVQTEGFIQVRVGTFPTPFHAWCNTCEVIAYHETTLSSTDYDGQYRYQWTPIEHLSNPNLPTTTVLPEETDTYIVTVTDTFGCTLSDSVTIKVDPILCESPFVFIPNSFTPNGDGQNDVFYVRSDILDECHLVIYNRWGEKVFETVQQEIGWDGTFKQKECQRGVYDYYFKGKCKDGDEIEIKGNVTLIR